MEQTDRDCSELKKLNVSTTTVIFSSLKNPNSRSGPLFVSDLTPEGLSEQHVSPPTLGQSARGRLEDIHLVITLLSLCFSL